MFDLKGKTAVVDRRREGHRRGHGEAVREQAGAKVECSTSTGGCDVTDEAQVKRRLRSRLGGIDILVNNAGRAVRKSAVESAADDWDAVIELNLTGALPLLAHRRIPS